MREDIIAMSKREVERLKIMEKVLDRQLTQAKAGEVMGISERQVRRLVNRVREEGVGGLVHRNRGKLPPNKMSEEFESQVGLILEEHYFDFGPTLASEKLWERHGIKIGRETRTNVLFLEIGLLSMDNACSFIHIKSEKIFWILRCWIPISFSI